MGKGGENSPSGSSIDPAQLVWREAEGGRAVKVPRVAIPEGKKLRTVTMAEVAQHDSKEDGWVAIEGYAYKIPPGFFEKHPGGRLPLERMLGRDASAPYINYHPLESQAGLKNLMVGPISDFPVYPVEADYNAATQELLERGLFETKASYYLLKAVWLSFLFGSAVWLTAASGSTLGRMAGAVMFGVFWQQLAFIGHDIGHNAISHYQWIDNIGGILIGNLLGGISIGWWKWSHNTHHIVCNSVEHDPDIQHLPVFAVTEKIFSRFFSSFHSKWMTMDAAAKFLVSYQHFLFYPIMAVARFNLYAQSYILLLSRENIAYKGLELACLAGFAVWFSSLVFFSIPTTGEVVAYLLLSHAVSGFLHVQICLSHFPMPTYQTITYTSEEDSWFKMQLETSLDISGPESMDWVGGGLQHQAIHHLWPRLPRHNLRKARQLVLQICQKHHIEYHEAGFVEANKMLVAGLKEVAMKARTLEKGDGGFYESGLCHALNAQG